MATGEWTLNPSVFLAICHLWGSPTIDLFAARRNTRLLTFGSPIPDMTRSIDVMSLDWKDMWGYRYPPDANTSFATDLSDVTDLSEDSTRFAILAWSPRCGRCMLFRTTSTTASRLPSNTTVAARSAHIGQDSRILPTSGYLRGSYPAGPRLVRLFGASGRMRSTILTGFHIESKVRRVLDGCTGRKLTSTQRLPL